VVVQIWREHGRLRARVQLVDEQGIDRGTRQLASDEEGCASLFDATALAISIALDSVDPAPSPSVSERPAPISDAPSFVAPAPVASSAPVDDPNRAAVLRTPRRAPIRWMAGVDAILARGTAPTFAPGLAFFAAARRGFWSIGVEALGDLSWPSKRGSAGMSVQSSVLAGAVVACSHWGPVFGCPLAELGALIAWGEGVSEPRSASSLLAAAGGRVGLEWPLSRAVALDVRGDLLGNLNSPRDFLFDGKTVWTTSRLTYDWGMGFSISFL
jgi:hypothetical protein